MHKRNLWQTNGRQLKHLTSVTAQIQNKRLEIFCHELPYTLTSCSYHYCTISWTLVWIQIVSWAYRESYSLSVQKAMTSNNPPNVASLTTSSQSTSWKTRKCLMSPNFHWKSIHCKYTIPGGSCCCSGVLPRLPPLGAWFWIALGALCGVGFQSVLYCAGFLWNNSLGFSSHI